MRAARIVYAPGRGEGGLAALCFLCAVSFSPLFGQATPTITGVGYEKPVPVVAPGQIVTLFVAGVGGVEEADADTIPLPTELAGFQVLVGTPESPRTPAPILSVKSTSVISDAAITVQIPYEIQAVSSPQLPTATLLIVSRNGVESSDYLGFAYTVELAPRIVKRCEYTSSYRYDCTPSITHADGRLVSWELPARPGEILVMYALGLGRTIPPTPTGAAPAEPRAVEWERAVQLFFDYSENAAPKVPPDPVPDHPVYVGAVPGFVGLYQINFRVPPAPPGTRLCDHPARSNLTVTVASKIYDGAGICVAP